MAKTRRDQDAADKANGSSTGQETVGGYFRRVFRENPAWLDGRSNAEVLKRWLADHPGEQEVPDRIKNIMSNVKSILRNKERQKPPKRPKTEKAAPTTPPVEVTSPPKSVAKGLEALEERIDGCLMLARGLNREELAEVVALLRQARNRVVWQLGE
jgi:hypothetical protein